MFSGLFREPAVQIHVADENWFPVGFSLGNRHTVQIDDESNRLTAAAHLVEPPKQVKLKN